MPRCYDTQLPLSQGLLLFCVTFVFSKSAAFDIRGVSVSFFDNTDCEEPRFRKSTARICFETVRTEWSPPRIVQHSVVRHARVSPPDY